VQKQIPLRNVSERALRKSGKPRRPHGGKPHGAHVKANYDKKDGPLTRTLTAAIYHFCFL
jgi:hypothetical protein